MELLEYGMHEVLLELLRFSISGHAVSSIHCT